MKTKAAALTVKRLHRVLAKRPPAWRRTIRIHLPDELARWTETGLRWGIRRFFKHRDSNAVTLLDDNGEFTEDAERLIAEMLARVDVTWEEHG